MRLTFADWFSHDYKLMPALGPLSAHFGLGESVQRNLICGSTASNAEMLWSVSQGLSVLLRSVLISVVVGRSVCVPLLPTPRLWYLSLGLHQLKGLSFSETGFAQGHFPVNGDAKEFTLRVTYCGTDCLFTGSFCPLQATRAEPRAVAVSGAFIDCLNTIVQEASSDQN